MREELIKKKQELINTIQESKIDLEKQIRRITIKNCFLKSLIIVPFIISIIIPIIMLTIISNPEIIITPLIIAELIATALFTISNIGLTVSLYLENKKSFKKQKAMEKDLKVIKEELSLQKTKLMVLTNNHNNTNNYCKIPFKKEYTYTSEKKHNKPKMLILKK